MRTQSHSLRFAKQRSLLTELITLIALWLGHESIQTTHVYVEADMATKERALNKLDPLGAKVGRFKTRDEGLAFLSML